MPDTRPVTELDSRFGSDHAKALDWEGARGLLENAELFWSKATR